MGYKFTKGLFIMESIFKVHMIRNGELRVEYYHMTRNEFFTYYKHFLSPAGFDVVSIIEI